uniref:Uncharacterized protein n=2 Tax=Caenorhabditis japonica TaxID=281687 RepID=A0A8R1DQE3_CAEJA
MLDLQHYKAHAEEQIGVLLDIHIGIVWRVHMAVPLPALCSNGLGAEFTAIMLQICYILLACSGISALSLFIHRMETVTMHVERTRLQRVVYCSKYMYYFFLLVVLVLVQFCVPVIKEQTELKGRMEQRYGKLPSFIWCENCFFFPFDSPIICLCAFFSSIVLCCILFSTISASLVSFRTLNSAAVRWSPKTKAIQKNLLVSLIISVLVLFFFIIFPLFLYIIVNFVMIDSDELGYFLILMMQEHGAAATFITFLTNKLLIKELKSIVKCCAKKKSKPGSRVISII